MLSKTMGLVPLTVLGTPIRRDAEGRYCLNDCHHAAGAGKASQPANFMRLDATKALIEEISRSSDLRNGPVSILQGGAAQGTFVVKELVYAYAMWISPAFHLAVIRAFDALVTGFYGKPDPEAELSDASRRALGGIVKSVVHKTLEPITEQLAVLQGLVSGVAIAADPRVAAVEFIGMLEILRREGVAPKGRRPLSVRCSNDLRRWIIESGREGAIRLSPESGKYIFHVDAARDWLNAGGRALIERHKAAVAGQSSLNFSKPSRSKCK